MAGRDFNIPMGPDRTGRISVPEVVSDAESSDDRTIAQPSATVDLSGLDVPASNAEDDPVFNWLNSPMDAAPEDGSGEAAPGGLGEEPEPVRKREEERVPEAIDGDADTASGDDVVDERPTNAVAESIGALRDSIGQGRELKAREKDRADLANKIDNDREELADRDDILANYQSLVFEQDQIIARSTQDRDRLKAELSQVVAETEETADALSRMRDYNDVQLQPLEAALGRAQATADQAKNDERSRKSELNAAESEVRRAEAGDDATTARARLDVVRTAHDEAVARSNAAKEALAEAQRAYDTLKDQVEQAEAPLERAIDDLEKRTEDLKAEITRLGDTISAASKRRQYCDSVYQYPAETEKLRSSVMADEAALDRLDEENDELRDRLAESKKKSVKAKVLIVGIVVFVIVLILLFWFLSSR